MGAETQSQPVQRALRVVGRAEQAPSSGLTQASGLPAAEPKEALRRLQLNLEAFQAEARCLHELLEELPAILERKFQLRLQTVLSEQRHLEAGNALLQHHLLQVFTQDASAAPHQVDTLGAPPEDPRDTPITQGLGLRRALRLRHR